MPIYGEKKKKDIIESVLPATRKGARNSRATFRRINRQERRRMNNALSNLYARGAVAEDIVDDYDADPFDYQFTLDTDKQYAMWSRRDYDNLNALYRWAPSQVEGVRLEDRASKIRAILPDTTIGRHAAGHVKDLDGFRVDHEHERYYWRTTPEEREEAAWILYAEWHNRLAILCENGNLSRFNDERISFRQVKREISGEEYQQRQRDGLDKWYSDTWTYYDRGRESYVLVSYEFLPLLGRKEIPDFIAEAFTRNHRGGNYDAMIEKIKELTM